MPAILRFLIGAFLGAIVAWFVGQGYVRFAEGAPDAAATIRGISRDAYELDVETRLGTRLLTLAVFGALFGGATAVLLAAATQSKSPARRRLPSGLNTPLTTQEFQQVLSNCVWLDFQNRGPDYAQGLIVGRLVESAPELAKKIDAYSDSEIDLLLAKLQKKMRTA